MLSDANLLQAVENFFSFFVKDIVCHIPGSGGVNSVHRCKKTKALWSLRAISVGTFSCLN